MQQYYRQTYDWVYVRVQMRALTQLSEGGGTGGIEVAVKLNLSSREIAIFPQNSSTPRPDLFLRHGVLFPEKLATIGTFVHGFVDDTGRDIYELACFSAHVDIEFPWSILTNLTCTARTRGT